jgi:uncharacterized YigZ family protein
MEDSYRTLEKPAEGSFREKGSRFLAFGFPVEDESQVKEILAGLRKKYHDARHHCYAWALGGHRELHRMNDDGEPSGTAGKPIYAQIVAHDLTQILVIVVRYFGGVLLGTGPLTRAYRASVSDMLSNGTVITRYMELPLHIEFPFAVMHSVMNILKEEGLETGNRELRDICRLDLRVRKNSRERIQKRLCTIPGLEFGTHERKD